MIQAGRELASRGHCVYVISVIAPRPTPGREKDRPVAKDGLAIIVMNIPYSSDMKPPDKIRYLAAYARKALQQGGGCPGRISLSFLHRR